MRRALQVTAWTAGALLLFVAVLTISVLIVGNTATGRIWIEQITWRLTKGHVRLAGLSGSIPWAPALEQLQLVDSQGTWLTADHISLRWSPLEFFAWRVSGENLQVERLDMERLPVSESKDNSKPHIPDIDVRHVSIGTLELGEQLTHMRAKLAVQGSVHLISLENAIAHVVARRTDGQGGDYEITLRFDPKRMDAHLKLEEPADGALENLLHYPGLGALRVSGDLSGPRNAEVLELNIAAGGLRAQVQGNLDITGKSANLAYSLDAPAMSPRPGLSWQKVALHGHWQGTVTSPHADGQLDVDALQSPGGISLDKFNARLSADAGSLGIEATASGLVIPGPQPRLLADSPIRIEASMRLKDSDRPVKLSADHQLFTLQADAITAGEFSTTFDLQLRDVSPLAAFAHQSAHGTGEVKGTVKETSAGLRVNVDASTQVARDSTLMAKLLGGTSRLQLAAAITDQRIDIEQFALGGSVLTAQVSGSAERGTTSDAAALQALSARYAISLGNVGALVPDIAGTLKVNGSLDGPVNSFSAQLQLTTNLSVQGSPLETIQASIKARGLPSQTSATLLAQGRFDSAPVQVDAAVQRAPGDTFRVTVHRGDWKSAHLEGDLTTAANFAPQNGTANLRIDHLADLQGLLGAKIDGALHGSLALHPVERRTQLHLQLDADNIATADLSGDAHLSATGSFNELSLKLTARSPDLKGEPASLDATASLNADRRLLGLEHADAHYHGQVLRLLAPARLSFADGLAINQLKLGLQHAVIAVDGRVSPAFDLRASVTQVDPALINAFVPNTLAEGKLEADAELKGSHSAPAGLVTVKASGVRFGSAGARDLHALDLHATARLNGSNAALDAKLSAGDNSQLALTGSAPFGGGGALKLKLTGKLDAGLANPVLEARGERAAGVFNIDTTITGRLDAPEIAGTIDLADGDVRDYAQGLHLSGITAHAIGSQGTLKIERLSAHAVTGDLSITGTLGLLQPKMPIELQLTAHNAQPFASDILTSNLNADLKLKGTLRERLDLSGTVNLNRTVIGIPNSLPPDIAVLDVRRPGQKPPTESKVILALDIQLHSPRELLVQGRGLNAELGGDVHLGGTTDSLHADGGFELVRGTFSLASSQLTFTRGKVSFNGSGLKHRIDPTLDFTAETSASDATATMHITGYADAPQFDLSSSPPLPQDEILARLLFGESAAQLTVLQVAEIGAALATLGGVGGSGPNPLVKVQKALGLDRLSVGGGTSTGVAGQTSGAAIEAGRYVSNRVFVGAKQSTTGFSQVEVDVDLSKHLKLQTRLGNGTATTQGTTPENDPGSSIGLMYQFEY
jgi:translocation and assembly module TamB